MKIAILTFHNSDNYGSVLQAYALRTILIKKRKNAICEVVNFIPQNQEDLYAIYLPCSSLKNIIKNIRAFFFLDMLKVRKKNFNDFRKNELKIKEEKIFDSNELHKYLNNFDAVVSGSDQIWNPLSLDFSVEYFVPNFNGRKVSYAPSFGNATMSDMESVDKADLETMKTALNKFNALSVREKSGIQLIHDMGIDRSVRTVLDPTLLLGREDWDNLLVNKELQTDDKYIFFYSIDYNSEAVEMVKTISKLTNLKVKIVFSTNKTYKVLNKGFEFVKNCSPYNFVSLIKNAQLVLSTSFHGVAFSTIYRKKFYALETVRGGEKYIDERIHNILEKFNLTNRILTKDKIETIDWNAIDEVVYDEQLIAQQIDDSLNYLLDNLYGNE